jgi:hypothetical protein
VAAAPPVKVAAVSDKWVTRLAVAAVLIAALTLLAFAGFWAMLGSGIDRIEQSSVQPIRSTQMLLPPDAQSQETSL